MSNKRVLALGADIKNRILFAKGSRVSCGDDIGDLFDAKNYEAFKSQISRFTAGGHPHIITYDMHPGYISSAFAKESIAGQALRRAAKGRCPALFPVQHHHAHIASVMYEHGIRTPVIGVSFDGTGYGSDGNMWGGEFLLVDRRGFRRIGHLSYRMMPGADKVVSEPWRMAVSILGAKAKRLLKGVDSREIDIVLSMMKKGINSPLSSSAGRLFDAAAALLGVCSWASYEAEGPVRLQAMCDPSVKQKYGFSIHKIEGSYLVDTDKIFQGMVKDLTAKKDRYLIATKFHNSMADIVIKMTKRISRETDVKKVALSGGVFQNSFLMQRAAAGLTWAGFKVYTNKLLPFNDLNIAVGQYYVSCNTSKG